MGLFSIIKESLSKHDCGNTCVKCTGVYIPKSSNKCNEYTSCFRHVYGEKECTYEQCANEGCCDCTRDLQHKPPQGK